MPASFEPSMVVPGDGERSSQLSAPSPRRDSETKARERDGRGSLMASQNSETVKREQAEAAKRKTISGAINSAKQALAQSRWYSSSTAVALRGILQGRNWALLMVIALLLALFMPDIWVLAGINDTLGIDIVLTMVMVLFTIELLLLSVIDSHYTLSFFQLMDVFGTVSMIFDISFMLGVAANEPQVASNSADATANLMLLRAARAAKVGARAGRLSRVLRFLRFLPFLAGSSGSRNSVDSPKALPLPSSLALEIYLIRRKETGNTGVLEERGSPTEIGDDTDEDLKEEPAGDEDNVQGAAGGSPRLAMHVDGTGGSPSRSKRARDNDGPEPESRRPLSPGDDRPVSSREFRHLLQEHLQTMTQAWGEMNGRMTKVEKDVSANKTEKDLMYSRIAQTERKQAESLGRIEKIEKDLQEIRASGSASGSNGGQDGANRPGSVLVAMAVLNLDVMQLEDVRVVLVMNYLKKIDVIQCLRAQPHRLASTMQGGPDPLGRPMWAQFVKTREARRRSSHGSLLRRVCLQLAKDAAHQGEAHNPAAVEEGAFDVDWNAGTVWLGEWKLGSSTHRPPVHEDVKLLSTGWVDVGSVAKALGVTWDSALGAFEREL
ncbi:unnamed protein product [Symbiodinium sp. CCMP2592]|nr:unnamed protein product [Symbiodinium sp. CCMP2592]